MYGKKEKVKLITKPDLKTKERKKSRSSSLDSARIAAIPCSMPKRDEAR